MKMKNLPIAVAFILWCWCAPGAIHAQVEPSPVFGENGIVFTKLGSGLDEAFALAVQDDGKIIVAGSTDNGYTRDIAVIRYLPDGSVDPGFSFTAGRMVGSTIADEYIRAVAILDDGTIVLGGVIDQNGDTTGVLVKLLDNGQLDVGFGRQGVGRLPAVGQLTDFHDIEILSNGAIVATGSISDGNQQSPLVARFLPSGAIDTSFGEAGFVQLDVIDGVFLGLEISEADDITACGYLVDENGRRGALLARLRDGALAEDFGDAGLVGIFNEKEEILIHDIARYHDGYLVVAGEVVDDTGRRSVMLGRFFADGTADRDFSENGLLVHDIGEESAAFAVTTLSDDTALAAGYRQSNGDRDTIVVMFPVASDSYDAVQEGLAGDFDGTVQSDRMSAMAITGDSPDQPSMPLDRFEQQAQLLTTAIDGSNETSMAIAVSSDGVIYTVGSSQDAGQSAIMVAGYQACDCAERPEERQEGSPVFSQFYAIETLPAYDITRVGAMTGAHITSLIFDEQQCLAECQARCPVAEEATEVGDEQETEGAQPGSEQAGDAGDCRTACVAECTAPTVEQRGVVFSISPGPAIDATNDAETENGDGGGGEAIDQNPANPFASGNFLNLDDYLVKGGQTDDGQGAGSYTSEIAEVNPQTRYYVRAYAVLSDGSVLYGNEISFRTKDSCFIATAAFGSIDHFAVQTLRLFRDRYLQSFEWGQALVHYYYRVSPPLADLVAASLPLRIAVLWFLLPIVAVATIVVYIPISVFVLVPIGAMFRYYR